MTQEQKLASLEQLNGITTHAVIKYDKYGHTLIIEGKYFEPVLDKNEKVFSDLTYINYEGDLYVEI